MRDTIDMAREAFREDFQFMPDESIKAFEALVRADEREACAQVCDELNSSLWGPSQCATAIRARGETK